MTRQRNKTSLDTEISLDYREFAPAAPLAKFVECFWSRHGLLHAGHVVVPDNCTDVLFELDGPAAGTRDGILIAGMMTAPLFVSTKAEKSIFAIRFRPAGPSAFLRRTFSEIQDARASAIDFWPELLSICTSIVEAPCDAVRCSIAERFLVQRLHPAWLDRRVTTAVELLWGGAVSIACTATILEISRQHLHRVFLEQVGLSPKSFSRVARVRRAMRLWQLTDRNAAAIAVEAGFADQPHMIREFRSITGSTPSRPPSSVTPSL